MRSPITAGVLLAALSAITFGVTVPAVARLGQGVGPLATATLLYAGACAFALVTSTLQRARRASPGVGALQPGDGMRLVVIAVLGAALAPTLLAWGLQRAGGTVGALLLNLEAFFTVMLARAIHHEPIGRRVAWALVLMGFGGALAALDRSTMGATSVAGALAIGAATLAWALDNTLMRPLAERDVSTVVAAKSGLGALLTTALALVAGEQAPSLRIGVALLACGAAGYGLSLRLYVVAQRRIGAARTASIFALAPFVGAGVGWAVGDQAAGYGMALATVFFGWGVYLHLTERHHHTHVHPVVSHTHAHRHDDGHHDHVHEPAVVGEHTHLHHHDHRVHAQEHAPDLHHDHPHPD